MKSAFSACDALRTSEYPGIGNELRANRNLHWPGHVDAKRATLPGGDTGGYCAAWRLHVKWIPSEWSTIRP
jgi:hypothetical protein